MSFKDIFLNFAREEAQDAHSAKALLETTSLDLAQSLKILLLSSHHKLHTMAKRDKCHGEEHFGETKTISRV